MHNDSAILHYNQREDDFVWDDDDNAIIHFDPVERDQPLPRKLSPPPRIPSTAFDPTLPTPQDPAGQGEGRKVAKPRSRKKKADAQSNDPTQLTEADGAELKSKMLDAIREDDELYHRILRYDVCCPLAIP